MQPERRNANRLSSSNDSQIDSHWPEACWRSRQQYVAHFTRARSSRDHHRPGQRRLARAGSRKGGAMVTDRRGFGERLKRQRERAGVTLETISQTTKVPVSLFAGLEAGDCFALAPGPVRPGLRAELRRGDRAEPGRNGRRIRGGVRDHRQAGRRREPAGAERPSARRAAPVDRRGTRSSSGHLGRRAGLAASELLLGALIAAIAPRRPRPGRVGHGRVGARLLRARPADQRRPLAVSGSTNEPATSRSR